MTEATEIKRKHPLASYLVSFLDKTVEGDSCIEWKGAKNDKGYGQLMVNGKVVYAHRYIYELSRGEILEDHEICHHCDNPSCVRPSHLFDGTHRENLIDAGIKGHMARETKGSKHGMAVLNEEQVLEIRHKYAMGGTTYKKLAREYDVYWSVIQKIVTRTTWKHI